MMRTRVTLKFYIFVLCSVYFSLLYVFYGRLQIEINQSLSEESYSNKLLQVSKVSGDFRTNPRWKGNDVAEMKRRMLESKLEEVGSQRVLTLTKHTPIKSVHATTTEQPILDEACYMSARYPNRSFQAINREQSFVYSAYLDERDTTPFVRIMAIFGNYKKHKLTTVVCHFHMDRPKSERVVVQGRFYELCENHGKKYGGFVISCKVPENMTTVCSVGVIQESRIGGTVVTIPVTRLEPKKVVLWRKKLTATNKNTTTQLLKSDHVPFSYSICVPPLFGKLKTSQFVEFVEVHRLLGFQHFIFYVEKVLNPEIMTVLKYYEDLNVVTVIHWHLPINGKTDIWYNGQLNAHNDCLYRAMSLSKYVAIIDIDEAVVPHDGNTHINDSLNVLLNKPNVCALSFNSAFYSLKFAPDGVDSDLITLSHLGRSQKFSTVRTKVMVSPLNIFEVGIHHVSKPLKETFKVLKVNQETTFLHHYRKCVPNYGMKCNNFVEENTMLKYKSALIDNIKKVYQESLSQTVFQVNTTAEVTVKNLVK